MRIQFKTYDSEMGRAAGGVFNVTAKSGSNLVARQRAVHEQAGLGHRPAVLRQARRHARIRRSTTTRGPDRSAARSIKDRTFFWFSKDDYMQKSTRNNVLTFPTMRERAGDFSQSPTTIYDPLTTTAESERHRLHPRSVPGQRHSRRSHQPDRAGDARADADADLRPLVQRLGDSRGRPAGSGDAEDRSPLGPEVDDDRDVRAPADR